MQLDVTQVVRHLEGTWVLILSLSLSYQHHCIYEDIWHNIINGHFRQSSYNVQHNLLCFLRSQFFHCLNSCFFYIIFFCIKKPIYFKITIPVINSELFYRWHNLTIVHEKVKVEFYLDGKRFVRETFNDLYYLGLDPFIYIGGGKNFVQTLGKCKC